MTGGPVDLVSQLAGAARESLSVCTGGTLHVDGLDCTSELSTEALLLDDEGCPTFLCDPSSPLVRAGTQRRAAMFSVLPGHTAPDGMTGVVLAGRLQVDGTRRVGETDNGRTFITTVRLRVMTVVIERDTTTLEVPLHRYRAAQPDDIASAAARIASHTNRCHAADLRAFAAGLAGVDHHEVVAAHLADVDTRGMTLTWIDRTGACSRRLEFTAQADSPRALAARLREVLLQRR